MIIVTKIQFVQRDKSVLPAQGNELRSDDEKTDAIAPIIDQQIEFHCTADKKWESDSTCQSFREWGNVESSKKYFPKQNIVFGPLGGNAVVTYSAAQWQITVRLLDTPEHREFLINKILVGHYDDPNSMLNRLLEPDVVCNKQKTSEPFPHKSQVKSRIEPAASPKCFSLFASITTLFSSPKPPRPAVPLQDAPSINDKGKESNGLTCL